MRFFDVENSLDYYSFGMLMPERFGGGDYRYSFQRQEADNEIKGKGNSVNYKYRMHDARLGRFFAVDPLASKYPHNSVYAFSENRVIDMVELEGLEPAGIDLSSETVGQSEIAPIAGSDGPDFWWTVAQHGDTESYYWQMGQQAVFDGTLLPEVTVEYEAPLSKRIGRYFKDIGDELTKSLYRYDAWERKIARQYVNNSFRLKVSAPIPVTAGYFTLETEIGLHNDGGKDAVPYNSQTLCFNLFGGELGAGIGFNYSKIHSSTKMYTKYGGGIRIKYFYAEVTNKDISIEGGYYQKNITLLSSATWFAEGYTGDRIKYLSNYINKTKKPFITLGFSIEITEQVNKGNYQKLLNDLRPQIEAGFDELKTIIDGE